MTNNDKTLQLGRLRTIKKLLIFSSVTYTRYSSQCDTRGLL